MKKFFVKFTNNKNLIIYPPNQKGHCLFSVDLDKLKKKELELFFDAFSNLFEIRATDAIDLYIYLKRRYLSFDIFTK